MKSGLYNLLASVAWILSTAIVIAWVGDLYAGVERWPARLGLLMAGVLASGLAFTVIHGHLLRERRNVHRHFEALCRLDPRDLSNVDANARIPPLPASSAWHGVAQQIRQALVGLAGRAEELEHLRSAQEIRCRRALEECEQVRAIFSSVPEPILAVNDYSELVLANRSAEELLRFDAERVENRALANLVRCEKLLGLLGATTQRKAAGTRSEEIEIVDGDGQSHWFRATATKLASDSAEEPKGSGPSSLGAVAVLREIGDLKALQKRNAEFVSAVSHEMKTPLAGIKAYVELLADGDAEDEETREEFLGVISGQADRLQRLVENLLNLARIEAGVVKVSKQTRALNELLEEAFHVVQPSAEAKHIQLTTYLSPMYLGVLADRDMLLQAAINLLSNAIKYTREGGRVTLRSRLADSEVQFEVQDTGVGLSEEDSHRVFEKFYRVSKDKNMASGTGLGLPLAKHIVEDVHGGRLTVHSKLGEGSTFVVSLPGAKELS